MDAKGNRLFIYTPTEKQAELDVEYEQRPKMPSALRRDTIRKYNLKYYDSS